MTKFFLNYKNLDGRSREEILEVLFKQITFLKREKKQIRITSKLKIFVLRSYDFIPSKIKISLAERLDQNKEDIQFRKFLDLFTIKIKSLGKNNYHFKMENIRSKRKFHFIIFDYEKYWLILTLTRKVDLRTTLYKIIRYLSKVEMVKLTSTHLEDIVYDQNFKDDIRGFIAKYKPKYIDRKITINVHGGDLKDLNRIRDLFFVEPTSFKFGKKNSPVNVLEGKIFLEGYFTIESIQEGYNKLAINIVNNLKRSFEKINDDLYEKVIDFENEPLILENRGIYFKSQYILTLKVKRERIKSHKESEIRKDNKRKEDKITFRELNENIIKYFRNKNRGRRYDVYPDFINRKINKMKNDKSEQKIGFNDYETCFSYFLCDKETRNKVQLILEPKDYNINLYPSKNCNGKTLRDICNGIFRVENSIESIDPFILKINN